jgi:hypothetical protein
MMASRDRKYGTSKSDLLTTVSKDKIFIAQFLSFAHRCNHRKNLSIILLNTSLGCIKIDEMSEKCGFTAPLGICNRLG